MLKSASTCLARDVIIDVAITFLCTPVNSNITKKLKEIYSVLIKAIIINK